MRARVVGSIVPFAARTLATVIVIVAGRAAGAIAAGEAAPAPHMIGEGTLSTPLNEFGGTVTPDGREMYLSMSVPTSTMYAIYVSRNQGGKWSAPELAPFSGRGRDFDPVLTRDGRTMFFISDRPVTPGIPKHDYDVWSVQRTAHGWSEPRNLGAPVNGTSAQGETDEVFAAPAEDGSLYIASIAPEGGMAIYRSKQVDGRYQPPEKLGPEINARPYTGEPVLGPGDRFMLYAAWGGKGGHGGWDIYISRHLPDGGWSEGENLGDAVNTPQRDYSPRLMPDGHTLIFTSERYFATGRETPVDWKTLTSGLASVLDGYGNLYEIDLQSLGLESLK
jgi:hypothetical protein